MVYGWWTFATHRGRDHWWSMDDEPLPHIMVCRDTWWSMDDEPLPHIMVCRDHWWSMDDELLPHTVAGTTDGLWMMNFCHSPWQGPLMVYGWWTFATCCGSEGPVMSFENTNLYFLVHMYKHTIFNSSVLRCLIDKSKFGAVIQFKYTCTSFLTPNSILLSIEIRCLADKITEFGAK